MIASLAESILATITRDPYNIYPYLSEITSGDLEYLFGHAYSKTAPDSSYYNDGIPVMLEEFLSAGLNINLINDDVQEKIFYKAYNPYTIKNTDIKKLADLFLKYDINMSNCAKACFLRWLFDSVDPQSFHPESSQHNLSDYDKVILSKIEISDDFVNYAVKNKHIDLIDKIFTYIQPKDLSFRTLNNALSIILSEKRQCKKRSVNYILEKIFASPHNADAASTVVNNKNILAYMALHKSALFQFISPELCSIAITIYPDAILFRIIADKLDANAQLSYCLKHIKHDSKEINTIPRDKLKTLASEYVRLVESINNGNISVANYHTIKFIGDEKRKIIDALIDTKFHKITWYKVMEELLQSNPDLPVDFVDHMRQEEKNIEPIIKKYWHGEPEKAQPVEVQVASVQTRHRCWLGGLFGRGPKS